MKNNKLKKINGTPIRLQYFNGFLTFMSLMTSIIFVYALYFGRIAEMPSAIFAVVKILSPVIILSIANRFLFGKVVCVVNKEGLHCEKGSFCWSEFDSVSFDLGIALPTRTGVDYSSVTLVAKDFKVTVDEAPPYLLRYIKKYMPNAKITLTKGSKFLIKLIAAVMIIAYLAVIFVKI